MSHKQGFRTVEVAPASIGLGHGLQSELAISCGKDVGLWKYIMNQLVWAMQSWLAMNHEQPFGIMELGCLAEHSACHHQCSP